MTEIKEVRYNWRFSDNGVTQPGPEWDCYKLGDPSIKSFDATSNGIVVNFKDGRFSSLPTHVINEVFWGPVEREDE